VDSNLSFNRVNPGGWAQGGIFTSSQGNQLDLDHVNALDKTVAGDTLSGVVTLASTGQISVGVSQGIALTSPSALVVGATLGLVTTVSGGLALGGGSSDWIQFNQQRSRLVIAPPTPMAPLQTGWSTSLGYGLQKVGARRPAPAVVFPLQPHHNSTIQSVVCYFAIGALHAAVPGTPPAMELFRVPCRNGGGSPPGIQHLSGTPVQTMPVGGLNGTTYYQSGNVQSMLYTATQNNLVDTSNYSYLCLVADETGSNSMFNNVILGIAPNYGSIADSRFP
jgi:hypothetical protein